MCVESATRMPESPYCMGILAALDLQQNRETDLLALLFSGRFSVFLSERNQIVLARHCGFAGVQ
jgi:hypothetical protein